MLEQSVLERPHPVEWTHAGGVNGEMQPVGSWRSSLMSGWGHSGGGGRRVWSKVQPRKKGGMGKRCF